MHVPTFGPAGRPAVRALASAALALALGHSAVAGAQDGAPPDGPPSGGAVTTADPTDPRGRWRLDMTVVTDAHIPVLGTTTAKARTTFVLDISGTPGAYVATTDPCRLRVSSNRSFASTRIPPAFETALKSRSAPLDTAQVEVGAPVKIDLRPQYMGFDPAKSGRVVPEDKEHPAVVDFEPDGDPGGTILLDAPLFGEVEVYIIQRAHSVLEGTWTSPNGASGRANILDYAQRNIGASNRLFVSNPTIKPDSARSTWSMVRVGPTTTCAQLSGGLKAPADDKQYGP